MLTKASGMHLVRGTVRAEAAAETCMGVTPSEHGALHWCSTGCGISLSLLSTLPGQGVMVWERGSAAGTCVELARGSSAQTWQRGVLEKAGGKGGTPLWLLKQGVLQSLRRPLCPRSVSWPCLFPSPLFSGRDGAEPLDAGARARGGAAGGATWGCTFLPKEAEGAIGEQEEDQPRTGERER